jgi:hypothetical protein
MGFNRRKMEDQRRQAADKEAAVRRATDAACHPTSKHTAKAVLRIGHIECYSQLNNFRI